MSDEASRETAHHSSIINHHFLSHGFSNDFLDGGDAFFDFNQTGAAERDHAVLDRFALDVDGRAAGQDEIADVVVDLHHLDEADAALVAGVVALLAATALVDAEGSDLFLLVAEVR